jgi:cation diffusion facilitator CzcD-associated flavoprotein CzcO
MTQQRQVKVAIIGAGISGLGMAAKLQDAGIYSYTVYEKADEVGGTWRDNTYPGLTCDVPSRYYSYSFAPNAKWSQLLSPGPEIQQYLVRVSDDRGIRRHIRFGCDVTKAEYDDGKWRLTTTFGEETFDVVVTATGVLRTPRYPDIPGRETFAGPAFHSARWDHSVTLPDKRIGLIGNGSSGVQIVSELGDGKVRQLTLFQRTAQWVMPLPNARYSALTRQLLTRVPAFNAAGRWFWGNFARRLLGRAPIRAGWQRSLIRAGCRWNLRSVRDPELRAKLTPTDEPMCKRQVLSSRFYRSVQHPTVDVVTDRIERIEPRGIVTADGTLHELDLLVYATGFDARAYLRPLDVIGEGGITLDEAWADGPTAYRSVAVPRFPNLFLLLGPHSPIGNQSFMAVAEDQADYAIWWIRRMRNGGVRAAAPTEVATKEYNERLKAAIPQTIFASGCDSWYIGKDGLPEVFPWTPETYTQLLRRPEVADFDVRTS